MKIVNRDVLRACGIALTSTVAAILLRYISTNLAPQFTPKNIAFPFFLIAIIVSGRYGGNLAAWFTLAFAAIPATYFRNGEELNFLTQKSVTALVIFLVTGTVLVLLTNSARTSRQASERHAQEALEKQLLLQREIEDRKAVEKELRERRQELELALEGGRLGIWSWDMRTSRIHSSETQARINGRAPHEIDMQFDDSLSNVLPEDRHLVKEAIERAIQKGAPDRTTYRVQWPDASIHWIEAMGQVFFDEAGVPIRAAGVCADVTDRITNADALETERQLLRNLLVVQENEKKLICYEVHDGLVQYAAGALLLLESYLPGQSPVNDREALDEAIVSLRRAVDEGRRVIRGVRPTVLDDSGVVAGIDDLVDQVSRPGLTVEFTPDEQIQRLPKAIETAIYRVTQEALTNARRHSGTDRVQIDLRRNNGAVHLEVRDFGCGFNPKNTRPNAFGLRGMRERVRLVGGECEIISEINAGTRVVATLPVHDNVEDDE